jgi:A/G-specific adenine glycosylase
MITQSGVSAFRNHIYTYYQTHGRDLPWRRTHDPYRILVSEFMLQQTQVGRVLQKYFDFLRVFPDPSRLAEAPLSLVLNTWRGLGYNRRARYLWLCAQKLTGEYGGKFPATPAELLALPGVGAATAGAVTVFAYDRPAVFIETNIRTVFMFFFFKGRDNVRDAELKPYIETTLDKEHPRHWYYALMDYGVYLKRRFPRLNRHSAHYKKQTPFKGSRRELRSKIISCLLDNGVSSPEKLAACTGSSPAEIRNILEVLDREGLVKLGRNKVDLA